MKAKSSVKSRNYAWGKIAFALAVVLGLIFAFSVSRKSSAQVTTTPMPTNSLIAGLTGDPINGVRPRGSAVYTEFSTGAKNFDLGLDMVNLPPGTNLNVFVGGAPVGSFNLGPFRNGGLRLSTMRGDTVPVPADGTVVQVRHAGNVIAAGVFRAPPPRPTSALYAPMSGPVIDGVAPRGVSLYAEFGGTATTVVRKLGVFVHRVNLAADTVLNVAIDGNAVGQITLSDDGDGGLRLNTANGDTVPTIVAGSTVTVSNGNASILGGTFREITQPPPNPMRNRVFGGRMNGRQMVPPVETNARGLVRVVLSPDRTLVRIDLAFRGLSSAQTTATINGPAQRGEVGEVIFNLGTIGGTQGIFRGRTFPVTPEQAEQLRDGLWYAQIGSTDNPAGEIRGQIRSHHRRARFLGNDSEDLAVFRPSNGTWYVKSGNLLVARSLGANGDIPVSGDFDGDGNSDYSVYRDGTWLIGRSSDGGTTSRRFGLAGDIPVQGDYDGDGRMDLAVFRPSNGVWYVQKSDGTGYIITQFGLGGDRPIASDLDGDGITDIAVFRPSNGVWYWLRSSTGAFGAAQFGLSGDIPITGDFDGDGADDLSVYRPSTGIWYALRSSDLTYDIRRFGISTDIPAAADFDGDDVTDIAVFRPSTRVWYIWRSFDNAYDFQTFGLPGDIPATKH